MAVRANQNIAGGHDHHPGVCHIRVCFANPPVELDYQDDHHVARRFAAAASTTGAVVTIDENVQEHLPPLPCRSLWT
ncbi:hypothetical protein [Nocardia paucivorans]|uniref:hypothetical protein n=1 Tax=Nocardia paucivorans TaxID=114259 RepID=UPI0002FAEFBA|nr:hypothetical protein [Nocardia paucivorans]